jgi:hypothetical protein
VNGAEQIEMAFVAGNIDWTIRFNNAIRPVQSMFCPVDARVHPSAFRESRMTHSTHRETARNYMKNSL